MSAAKKGAAAGGTAGLALVIALGAQPMVEGFEGLRNDPYWDIARVRTYCYGETQNVQERRYSTAECKALLMRRLTEHTEGMLRCIPATAPIPTLYAFASFTYNVGAGAVCGSTAARLLRQGDVAGACNALMMWTKVTKSGRKVHSNGLAKRRAAERDLCIQGTLRRAQ